MCLKNVCDNDVINFAMSVRIEKRASTTRWISFKFHISNFYQNLFTWAKNNRYFI